VMDLAPIINGWFSIAAGLAVSVGATHSVLGEVLIFSGLRHGGIVPIGARSGLLERQVRILWATWHLPTIFSFMVAAILIRFSVWPEQGEPQVFVVQAIIATTSLSAAIVFVATRGKHPGWIGLLAIAATAWRGLA
jgi:hypothetical protein